MKIEFTSEELLRKKNLIDLGEEGEFLADEVEIRNVDRIIARGTWIRYEKENRKEIPATLDILLAEDIPGYDEEKEEAMFISAGELMRLPWIEADLDAID